MEDNEHKEKKLLELKVKNLGEKNNQNSPEKYKNKYLSNTAQNFNKISKLTIDIPFKGFFNKRFNLTKYKESRAKSYLLSHSLEKIIKPHKLRGNGIPEDIYKRIHFLKKIFFSEKIKSYIFNSFYHFIVIKMGKKLENIL